MGGHPSIPQVGRTVEQTGRNKVVKERLQQVPQQTTAPMPAIQQTVLFYSSPLNFRIMSISANCSCNNRGISTGVFKNETGGVDVEATVSSASFEIQWEGIQLHR